LLRLFREERSENSCSLLHEQISSHQTDQTKERILAICYLPEREFWIGGFSLMFKMLYLPKKDHAIDY